MILIIRVPSIWEENFKERNQRTSKKVSIGEWATNEKYTPTETKMTILLSLKSWEDCLDWIMQCWWKSQITNKNYKHFKKPKDNLEILRTESKKSLGYNKKQGTKRKCYKEKLWRCHKRLINWKITLRWIFLGRIHTGMSNNKREQKRLILIKTINFLIEPSTKNNSST